MVPLAYSRFEKLKRLEFKRNCLGSADPLISIFKDSTESLKEMVINQYFNRIFRNSKNRARVDSALIEFIGLYCQNLHYLEIFIESLFNGPLLHWDFYRKSKIFFVYYSLTIFIIL